jgi:hypothetical protein
MQDKKVPRLVKDFNLVPTVFSLPRPQSLAIK